MALGDALRLGKNDRDRAFKDPSFPLVVTRTFPLVARVHIENICFLLEPLDRKAAERNDAVADASPQRCGPRILAREQGKTLLWTCSVMQTAKLP